LDGIESEWKRLLRNVAVNGEDVGEAMIAAGVARDYGTGRRSWC
jgi:micrococcal nuclease